MLWQADIAKDLYLLKDEGLLRQVFTNLRQNALHYTNAGDAVTLSASRTSFKLLIKVEDTGIGIAAEHLDRIFERFWRAEKYRSYQASKSGLGLAIVREIIWGGCCGKSVRSSPRTALAIRNELKKHTKSKRSILQGFRLVFLQSWQSLYG